MEAGGSRYRIRKYSTFSAHGSVQATSITNRQMGTTAITRVHTTHTIPKQFLNIAQPAKEVSAYSILVKNLLVRSRETNSIMSSLDIRPFEVNIPTNEVERLKRKLKDTRLPKRPIVPDAGDRYGQEPRHVISI
jgi:hypothetical protein